MIERGIVRGMPMRGPLDPVSNEYALSSLVKSKQNWVQMAETWLRMLVFLWG